MVVFEKIDYAESAGMGSHPDVEGGEIKDFECLIAGHAFLQETKPLSKLGDVFRTQGLGRVGQGANDFGFHNRLGGYWRRSRRGRRGFAWFDGAACDAAGDQKQ